jgi:hypothetical protein
LEPMFLTNCELKNRSGRGLACPHGIDYNLRARRNELSAKKKKSRAKATAVAMIQ